MTLISDIAEQENIPPRYLEHILLGIKKAGLLESKRGVGGGYGLGKDAKDITLGDIIRAVDGPITQDENIKQHKELTEKNAIGYCLYNIMKEVGSSIVEKLDSISLKSMAQETIDAVQQKRNVLTYAI